MPSALSVHSATAPIGVFDSGVGGLSVLRAIRTRLPREPLIYVADSGHAPYGDRDIAYIRERAIAIVGFLVAEGAKEVVVACNTATVVAIEALRAAFDVPIVALEPAIKPAVEATRSKVVGVLATTRTLESPAVTRLASRFGSAAHILLQPCPGLVEQVEHGAIDDPATTTLLERHLAAPMAAGADQLVLGCTHYAFLRERIQAIVGPEVTLIDSADAVARQTERRLPFACAAASGRDRVEFYASGDPALVAARIEALWGAPISVRALPV